MPPLEFLPYPLDFDRGEITKSPKPRVVFLGRLDPIKRPWVFVELAREFPHVEFLLLGQSHFHGPGDWEPTNIPHNVRFLGHVGGEEKRALLASAWLLVNTSIHEALPVSFLEALVFQIPIVSCQNPEDIVSLSGATRADSTVRVWMLFRVFVKASLDCWKIPNSESVWVKRAKRGA